MRAFVTRVSSASVDVVEGGREERVGEIGAGLLVLVGVTHDDDVEVAGRLAEKVAHLRIFDDEAGVPNLAVGAVGGAVLVVSQFTLYGDTRKGRRPSYVAAARPDHAERLVDAFVDALAGQGLDVATGRFRTFMRVASVNDGPMSLLLEVPVPIA